MTLEAPADDALTNDSTLLFSGHASIAAGDSDTVNVEVYRPVASGPDELVQSRSVVRSSGDGSWSVAASPALADGTYIAYATQDDSNADTAYSAPRTFTVDASAPGVTLTKPATGLANDPTPTLGGGAGTDSGDSATVTVKVYAGLSISGSPVQTLPATRSGGTWSIEPSTLADGTYTARAEQADAAGNTGTSAPRTFSIDATGPDTLLSSGPSGTTTATSADFVFSASEAGSSFECRLDGGAWTACSSPQSYSALGLGSHAFDVRASDGLGNVDGTPASGAWTISAPGGGTPPGGTPGTTPPDTTPSGALELAFSLRARSPQRMRQRTRALILSASCDTNCTLRLSGKITLSRSRKPGLTKRQAAATRLKLRAASYQIAGGKSTRVRLRISRRLARRVVAGLRQSRRVSMSLTGVATHSGALPRTVRVRIKLKR